MEASSASETYLGFDLSTQKLKAIQVNSKLETLVYAEVKFDEDLPEYGTSGGINGGAQENEFFAQPTMWIKALDLILLRLSSKGVKFNTVSGISGSAQQHGSIYWTNEGIAILRSLDPDQLLHTQITVDAFSINNSPIWMDNSAEEQCKEIEQAVGGSEKMIGITGSRCYPRFTGPQIRKIYQLQRDNYNRTQRISLVSSFFASLFLGDIAPIDFADGSGMNLLDIRQKVWSNECLHACAPDLERRLGQPVPTCKSLGNISKYFVKRYNFRERCMITAFTGDNPSSLCGMIIGEDWLVMSLGTSDTILAPLPDPKSLQNGHCLCHPTGPGYLTLLCFRNGSLVRESCKRNEANNSWDTFNELLELAPRGNDGNMALHFQRQEIIPRAKGTLKWESSFTSKSVNKSKGVRNFGSSKYEVRALIEGQILQRKAAANDIDFKFGTNTKILATGGASVNKSILQVIADVFKAPVYIQRTAETALFGAALRAIYVLYKNSLSKDEEPETYENFFMQYISQDKELICEPHDDSLEIYLPMLEKYKDMVVTLMEN